MNPYSYPKAKSTFDLRLKQQTQGWFCYEITFASAHNQDFLGKHALLGKTPSRERGELVI